MNPLKKRDTLIGWYGTIVIIGSYVLLSTNIIGPGIFYQLLNLTGALSIAWITFLQRARQSMIINIVWAFIALAAIIHILL